jgi:hypothetical protein
MTRKTKSPASLRSGARARESDHAGRLIKPYSTARPVGQQQPQLSREGISVRDNGPSRPYSRELKVACDCLRKARSNHHTYSSLADQANNGTLAS